MDKFDLQDQIMEQSILIKMMDRMDSGTHKGIFEYDERLRNHFRLVCYWQNTIEDLDINRVIFERPPHTISDYTLFVASKLTDTDIVIMKDIVCVPGFKYSQEEMQEPAIKNYKKREICEKSVELFNKNITEIRARESENSSSSKKSILRPLRYLTVNPLKLGNKYPNKRLKRPYSDIEDSVYSYFKKKLTAIRSEIKKIKLQQNYSRQSKKPDLTEKYIYFPLHYQPELSSCPQGGIYVHQFLIANLISCNLPGEWKLLIKEHPVTFGNRKPKGRMDYHYRHLNKLDSVELVSMDTNQMNIIDNSEAVATITGTPGWEAIVRGKPALVFGNAWYKQCNGAQEIETDEDLKAAIEDIKKDYGPSKKDPEKFVRELSKIGSKGKLINDPKMYDDLKEDFCGEENVNSIVEQLQKHI